MSALSDERLLERLRIGDSIALEAIFERYETILFSFLMGLLKHRAEAEDALQETFIKALKSANEIQGDKLRAWLFTVAYREAMQLKRTQRRRATQSLDDPNGISDPIPEVGAELERMEDQVRWQQLLDRLPPIQREVIVARIFHGKRFREIANDLGCPLNTALARMHDGLKKLRTLWEESHVQ